MNCKFIKTSDVAQMLCISRSRVYQLVRDRKIPYYKPSPKTLFFTRVEIEEYILRSREPAIEEELAKEKAESFFKKKYN